MKNLLYLILLVIPTLLIAQNSVAIDTTQANLLYSQSVTFYEQGEYKKAEDLARQAIEIYQKELGGKSNALAEAWYQIGQCQSNKGDFPASIESFENVLKTKSQDYPVFDIVKNYGDMVYSYGKLGDNENREKILDIAIQLSLDSLGKDDETLVPLYVYKSHPLTDAEQFKEAFSYLQKASTIADMRFKNSPLKLAKVESAIAKYHFKKGDYQNAANRVEKIAKSFEESGNLNTPNLASCYSNMAACYQELRSFDKALFYLHKTLSIFEKIGDEISMPVINSNLQIGKCLSKLGRREEAIVYFEKVAKVLEDNFPSNNPLVVNTEEAMARCFKGEQKYNKAIPIFKEVREKMVASIGTDRLAIATVDQAIGQCYLGLGEYSKAEEHYNTAYEIIKAFDFIPPYTPLYTDFGNLYSALNNIEKAEEYYGKALQTFDYDTSTGFIKGSRYQAYLDVLEKAAQLKIKAYEARKEEKYLDEALDLTRSARKFIIHLKSVIGSSVPHLIQSYKGIYEGNIKALMHKQDLYENQSFSEEAFQVMEEAKGNLTLLALKETEAKFYRGLSQKELEEESELQTSIVYFETKIYEEQSKDSPNDSVLIILKDKLFIAKKDYQNRLAELEKDNPAYFNLKYNQKLPTLKETQAHLDFDQLLVEYFISDNTVYILTLSDTKSDLYSVKVEGDLASQIEKLRKGLYNYWLLPADKQKVEDYAEHNELYVQNAHVLYSLLIEPLGELPTSLIIIPDGLLSYIPFEVLLKEKPTEPSFFKSHTYLGNEHQISYNYSVSLWKEMRNKSYSKHNLLAFAPSFSEEKLVWTNPDEYRRGNLSPLFYNIREVEEIQKIVGGTIKTKEEATSDFFFSDASNYGILHFATHAKVEDKNTDFSYLAFYDTNDSLARDKVYLRDLYNMDLPAQMVVLSACETGIGKLQKGEGMISLARGFTYSGTKSIITSLWEANDQASADLMVLFYQNIKEGMTKDAALQQAKNTYINNATSHKDAHPANWATFVALGDMEALNIGGFWSFQRFAFLVLILVGLLFFYFFLKKR